MAKRGAALALQLGEWSPFAEFDHAVAWTPGGRAMVWCWDLAALRTAWSAASALRMPPTVPESALRAPSPPPSPAITQAGGSVRLVMTLDGCEAQAWRDGEILTSRWWPALPSNDDARLFVRDAGLDPSEVGHGLTPSDAPLAQRTWIPLTRAGRSGQPGGLFESAVYAALVTSVVVPASVLGVEHARVRQAQAQVAEELQRESQRSKAVLDARNAALAAVQRARTLIELQPYPPPLMHMAAVATELPATANTSLREWQLTDGKLRLLFESTAGDISGAEHVRALERTALFDDVKIVTQADPRQMAFQLTLRKTVALDTAAPVPTAPVPAR